ncbi:MAG: hypothetical protein ACXVC6_07260 [Bacteroidia bacterium]
MATLTEETRKTAANMESFTREETVLLRYEQPVSDIIKFNAGEASFTIEANVIRRDYLLLSLGGFDMSGKITNFRSRDLGKEFPVEQYQWMIIKSGFLKEGQQLEVKIKFK